MCLVEGGLSTARGRPFNPYSLSFCACRRPTTRAASFDGTRSALLVTAVSLCHSTRFTVEAPLDSLLSQLANGDDRLQSTSTGLDGFRVGDRCGG